MELCAEEMEPRVLRADKFSFYVENQQELRLAPRRCFNYELELFSVSGGVLVDGEYVELKPGDMNLRRPGQVVCGVPPYHGYVLCFSLGRRAVNAEGYIFGSPKTAEPNYENSLLDSLPARIVAPRQGEPHRLFKSIAELNSKQNALSRFGQDTLLRQLLYLLFAEQQEGAPEPMNRKVLLAADYVRSHYLEELEIGALIRESGLSKAYFHKCFRACTGATPVGLVTKLRMERAKTLLQLTQDSIGDIAAACGYLDHVYFSHMFHKYVGLPPSKYRRSLQ